VFSRLTANTGNKGKLSARGKEKVSFIDGMSSEVGEGEDELGLIRSKTVPEQPSFWFKMSQEKEKAHTSQILAIASTRNQLYSSSNKSLKIWDLENMKCISDINAGNGFIRAIAL